MNPASQHKVGILGLGQIGGSIATRLSLEANSPCIIGHDLHSELQSAALQAGAISEIAESEIALLARCDIVVIALPIGEIIAFLRRQQDSLRQKTAILDTGSVKKVIAATAEELGLVNFIGGHPLAGTELRGMFSWNYRLFEQSTFFLTVGRQTLPISIETIHEMVRRLGATPFQIDSDMHDRLFAVTSNLSHLTAYALRKCYRDSAETPDDKMLFESPSFKSATRVADSDPDMVFQMLWHNREHLSETVGVFLRQMQSAKKALEDGDETGLAHFLDIS